MEVRTRLWELLEALDPTATTIKDVRTALEEAMGVDLRSRRGWIKQQIVAFVQQRQQQNLEEEVPENITVKVEPEEEEQQCLEIQTHRPVKQEEFNINMQRTIRESKPKRRYAPSSNHHQCYKLSEELAALVGKPEASKFEISRCLMKYVQTHKLQVSTEKRAFRCDDTLRKVFKDEEVAFRGMLNLLRDGHVSQLETITPSPVVEGPPTKKLKTVFGPQRISKQLMNFLGLGKPETTRPDVVKKMWVYIKEHNLQDPWSKRMVLCDAKLQELFKCKSFTCIRGMTEHLESHYLS